MKQTRNAMHMLIEAYKAIYKHAMGKGSGSHLAWGGVTY